MKIEFDRFPLKVCKDLNLFSIGLKVAAEKSNDMLRKNTALDAELNEKVEAMIAERKQLSALVKNLLGEQARSRKTFQKEQAGYQKHVRAVKKIQYEG